MKKERPILGRPQLWWCNKTEQLRIFHPDGDVEIFFNGFNGGYWDQSAFATHSQREAVKAFKSARMLKPQFVCNL